MSNESTDSDDDYWKRRAIQDQTGRCADCGKYILHEMYFDFYREVRIDWDTERCVCACEKCDIVPDKYGDCECEFCSICESYVPDVVSFEDEYRLTICKACALGKRASE